MAEDDYFGQLLADYRHARCLSQKELAERATVSESTLGNIESGRIRRPHLETVRLLASALNLTPAQREQFLDAARGRTAMPATPTLPHAPSSFIGRERELAALRALLPASRLLTLVGTGGCGKTRLALELVRALDGDAPGGIWWIDLAAVFDAEGVAQVALTAVGARPAERQAPREALIAWAATRAPLVILDNCEHLHEACADLAAALLGANPAARVLATSRRPLGLPGERVWRVPPLSLPAVTATTAMQIESCEAIRLLIERAEPGFALTDRNASAVATLCRRLDGLPLALELAAARLHAFDPAALVARLDGYFALLGRSTGPALPRHQTIRAILDWSYDNLDPAARAFLRRLAPFVGGFTLAAAEAVGQGLEEVALARGSTIPGLLAALVEQSLVVAEGQPGESRRYQLLETIRAYAREKLAEEGEADLASARHCAWFTALAERVHYPLDGGAPAATWRAALAPEVDNLRAALAWARDRDPVAGLRLIAAAWPYWLIRLSHAEARSWLDTFLALTDAAHPRRSAALQGLGYLTYFDRVPLARSLLAEALELARAAGDTDRAAAIHWMLALVCLAGNDHAQVTAQIAAGWELVARDKDARRQTPYRIMRGLLALEQGDLAGARARLSACESIAAALDQPLYRCMALVRLGAAHLKAGEAAAALAAYDALLGVADDLGCWFYRSIGHSRLAAAREWSGDLEGARVDFDAGLAMAITAGGSHLERVVGLLAQARLALYRGAPEQAVAPLTEGAALLADFEHPPLQGDLAYLRGLALWRTRRDRAARAHLERALCARGCDPARLALRLEGIAGLAAAEGQAALAARWLGWAETLREQSSVARPPVEVPGYEASWALIRAQLAAPVAEHERGNGRSLTREEVVSSARAWLRPSCAVGQATAGL